MNLRSTTTSPSEQPPPPGLAHHHQLTIAPTNSFFQDLDRLFAADYVPNNQDVLRSRLKTTGITETIFDLGRLTYRMFDVGGQRSERKKWIHCFENVNCVLFLVAISGYDQCLVEEMDGVRLPRKPQATTKKKKSKLTLHTKNQMQEAFMLFESISNSRWFTKTSLILFLNKIDLFRAKLASSPITKYFPDYDGDPTDASEASRYFRDRFLELSRDPKKVRFSPNFFFFFFFSLFQGGGTKLQNRKSTRISPTRQIRIYSALRWLRCRI
jgi:G-protein alpha subunit